jgi:hypothetical protein
VLFDNGDVVPFGDNDFGQCDVPNFGDRRAVDVWALVASGPHQTAKRLI